MSTILAQHTLLRLLVEHSTKSFDGKPTLDSDQEAR